MTKTGGGSDITPDPSIFEEKVLSILGKAAVNGIEGGLDTITMANYIEIGLITLERVPEVQSNPEPMKYCCSKSSPLLLNTWTSKRITSTPPDFHTYH